MRKKSLINTKCKITFLLLRFCALLSFPCVCESTFCHLKSSYLIPYPRNRPHRSKPVVPFDLRRFVLHEKLCAKSCQTAKAPVQHLDFFGGGNARGREEEARERRRRRQVASRHSIRAWSTRVDASRGIRAPTFDVARERHGESKVHASRAFVEAREAALADTQVALPYSILREESRFIDTSTDAHRNNVQEHLPAGLPVDPLQHW